VVDQPGTPLHRLTLSVAPSLGLPGQWFYKTTAPITLPCHPTEALHSQGKSQVVLLTWSRLAVSLAVKTAWYQRAVAVSQVRR
jgi:hypothetical protein